MRVENFPNEIEINILSVKIWGSVIGPFYTEYLA